MHHQPEEVPAEPTLEFSNYSVAQMGELLGDESQNIAKRSRLLWHLRNLPVSDAIAVLESGLDKSKSCLLKHEICYVLGQMRAKFALPLLYKVLANMQENTMVRHEVRVFVLSLCVACEVNKKTLPPFLAKNIVNTLFTLFRSKNFLLNMY